MKFNVVNKKGNYALDVALNRLIVVGFAGKDVKKTMEHIKELEEHGIKCPKTVPVVYECSKEILTTADSIDVIGNESSGEVEYLVLFANGKTYIGIGSDHTDRAMEAISIHKSKQVCLKPLATDLWDFEEIKEHFGTIKLVSQQTVNGQEVAYQSGLTSDLLSIERIVEEVKKEISDLDNCLLYTGTVPLKDGFKYGEQFSCKLIDGTLNREIALSYKINVIKEH